MRIIKAIGSTIKNFMILFSFIVNLILVVVILALVLFIFDIKNNIVTPLVNGLHSSFVGLDESTIDWTIPVRDQIPVVLNIPLETDTIVTLTSAVPVNVIADIVLPGVGVLNNAQVALSLPEGLELPVRLNLNVPVDQMLDVSLDVRAVIPINETQLHDPIDNLRLVFDPLTRGLYNLPDNFDEAGQMVSDALAGREINLLADNPYSDDPWAGFSRTAGVSYGLNGETWPIGNQPLGTGIIPPGGIPALDEAIRPELYTNGGPFSLNDRAEAAMTGRGIASYFFNGTYSSALGVPFADPVAPDILQIDPGEEGGTVDNNIAPTPMQVMPSEMMPTAETLPRLVVPQITPVNAQGTPLAPPEATPAPGG